MRDTINISLYLAKHDPSVQVDGVHFVLLVFGRRIPMEVVKILHGVCFAERGAKGAVTRKGVMSCLVEVTRSGVCGAVMFMRVCLRGRARHPVKEAVPARARSVCICTYLDLCVWDL